MSRYVTLNGQFGALFNDVTPRNLGEPEFQDQAKIAWRAQRGLLVVRGTELADITPQELTDWASVFGAIDDHNYSARDFCTVPGYSILRMGNTTDAEGNPNAMFAEVPTLTENDNGQYDPQTQRPVWHTDSTFKPKPPIGSVFHCKKAPASGGDTLFADMQGGYESLSPAVKKQLAQLEAVCSLAHHDKKVNLYSPTYPVLSAQQRLQNPPNRVPIVLRHPNTGALCFYGMNSSTCAVVPKGAEVGAERMDKYDLQGIEDESVGTLRELLPDLTRSELTVRWRWQQGDIVVWDNRCTMHAPSGFDHHKYQREMWRLTLVA